MRPVCRRCDGKAPKLDKIDVAFTAISASMFSFCAGGLVDALLVERHTATQTAPTTLAVTGPTTQWADLPRAADTPGNIELHWSSTASKPGHVRVFPHGTGSACMMACVQKYPLDGQFKIDDIRLDATELCMETCLITDRAQHSTSGNIDLNGGAPTSCPEDTCAGASHDGLQVLPDNTASFILPGKPGQFLGADGKWRDPGARAGSP